MKKFQDESVGSELLEIARGIKASVRYQAELGVEGFIGSNNIDEGSGGLIEHENIDSGVMTLSDIRKRMGDCKLCALHKGRTQIVFGDGPDNAELMFVGEAPGADEDREGKPFVGRAGQLLTKIITAMHFDREEVYIANVNKCRPPENRDPKTDEVAACEPFLVQQILAIKPKVIVALGRWAAQTLLKTSTPITALRGKFYDYHGIKLIPTYHPAAVLRYPQYKKPVWEDMQQVMKLFGKEP